MARPTTTKTKRVLVKFETGIVEYGTATYCDWNDYRLDNISLDTHCSLDSPIKSDKLIESDIVKIIEVKTKEVIWKRPGVPIYRIVIKKAKARFGVGSKHEYRWVLKQATEDGWKFGGDSGWRFTSKESAIEEAKRKIKERNGQLVVIVEKYNYKRKKECMIKQK